MLETVAADRAPQFVTLVLGSATPLPGGGVRLLLAGGGHLPPLVVRPGGVEPVDIGGMLVGAVPEARFRARTVDLAPGESCVLYSDGVIEALGGVDGRGLDPMDRRYLACIAENYGGGPVGVETLAAALSEQRDVIEDVIEPYLMQLGLPMRTPRGRLLSEGGYRHLGVALPREQKRQLDLLAAGEPEDEA